MWPFISGMSYYIIVCYFYIWYVISVFGMFFPPWSVGSALGGLKKKSDTPLVFTVFAKDMEYSSHYIIPI